MLGTIKRIKYVEIAAVGVGITYGFTYFMFSGIFSIVLLIVLAGRYLFLCVLCVCLIILNICFIYFFFF